MKSTQTELLTTRHRLDVMLQRIMPKVGTMSPIQEEGPEQVASSGEIEEKQDSADQQQSPLFTSSWFPIVPRFSGGMQTTAMGVPVEQEQSQSQAKGTSVFTSVRTSVGAGMRTRLESPVEQSRPVTPPFTAAQFAR